jgi:hypothetical protein
MSLRKLAVILTMQDLSFEVIRFFLAVSLVVIDLTIAAILLFLVLFFGITIFT